MRDFLPVMECVAKFVRGGFAMVGAVTAQAFPARRLPQLAQSSAVDGTAAECTPCAPSPVSMRCQLAADMFEQHKKP